MPTAGHLEVAGRPARQIPKERPLLVAAPYLVGAQAIYLHTGDADLGVAEYTIDADLALDPDLLAEIPPLEPLVDLRVVRAKVAGPGALLVAKMFKTHEDEAKREAPLQCS